MDRPADGDASLTGLWSGLYHYPALLRPVFFTATLISHGGSFSGSCHEVAESVHGGRSRARTSSLSGAVEGSALRFAKACDGAGGWAHRVLYGGRLSADRSEVEGTWSVPGDWSGRFLMVRSERMREAELRRAFERA